MGIPDIRVERATVEHFEAFAPVMRAQCIREAAALGYQDHREALLECYRSSEASYAVFFGKEIAVVCGVRPAGPRADPGDAVAWCLTGHAVAKNPRAFLRVSPHVLRTVFGRYDRLFNFVDARCEDTIRWAIWLGFEVAEPILYGPKMMPFHPVTIRRAHVF